jgi:hypothetical protein
MGSVVRWHGATLALGLLLAGVGAAFAQAESAPPEGGADALDPAALAIVERAGDFLRDAEHMSFSAEMGYEAVQADGTRVEFGSTRQYRVARPDRVGVETETRSGDRKLTVFDGTTFVMADLVENAYARANLKSPRDIDFMVDLVRERLDAHIPLAELLRNDPRRAIEDALESAEYVGASRLRGVDCDHLLLTNVDTDLQLWVAKGEQPLLQRVVITYRDLEGEPLFWADFDEWKFGGKSSDDQFRFTPAEGAERVRFEVQSTRAPAEEGSS